MWLSGKRLAEHIASGPETVATQVGLSLGEQGGVFVPSQAAGFGAQGESPADSLAPCWVALPGAAGGGKEDSGGVPHAALPRRINGSAGGGDEIVGGGRQGADGQDGEGVRAWRVGRGGRGTRGGHDGGVECDEQGGKRRGKGGWRRDGRGGRGEQGRKVGEHEGQGGRGRGEQGEKGAEQGGKHKGKGGAKGGNKNT